MNVLATIGRLVLEFLAETGRIALFAKDGLWLGLSPRPGCKRPLLSTRSGAIGSTPASLAMMTRSSFVT